MLFPLLAVIGLLRICTFAQLLSEQAVFRNNDDSTVQCWGDMDRYRRFLNVPQGISLAQACTDFGVRMECGYSRSPEKPYFSNEGYNERLMPCAFMPPWDATLRADSAAVDYILLNVCSIKCACKKGSITQSLARYDQNEPFKTVALRFDEIPAYLISYRDRIDVCYNLGTGNSFLMSSEDLNDAADLTQAQYVYGLDLGDDAWERGTKPAEFPEYRLLGDSRLDRFYRPPDDIQSPLRSTRLVGYKENAPKCFGDSVEDDFGEAIWAALSVELPGNDKISAQELCAHQFYGGRSQGNLGAFCYNPRLSTIPEKKSLVIMNMFKAPQFTNDFYEPQLLRMSVVVATELYCKSHCTCFGEDENDLQPRVQQWHDAVKLFDLEDSEQNTDIAEDQSVIEHSNGSEASYSADSNSESSDHGSSTGGTHSGSINSDDREDIPASGGNSVGGSEVGSSGASGGPSGTANSQSSPGLMSVADSGSTGLISAESNQCQSNADCCPNCVCIVKLQESLTAAVQWVGSYILACIARKAINPYPRDHDELKRLRRRDLKYEYEALEFGR